MADCFILLNSGDKILLNDGVSALLKNSCDEVVVSGVTIEGTHATADLRGMGEGKKKKRVLVYTLEAYGQVSRQHQLTATAKTQRIVESTAIGKISKVTEAIATAKTVRVNSLLAEARVYSKGTKGIQDIQDVYDRNNKTISYIREARKEKLKKMFDDYKEQFDVDEL